MTAPATPTEHADANPASRWVGLVTLVGLLAFLGVMNPWALVIVLALVVFIFLHEAGHYVTARWTGMKATEFFLGFGPRIFSFRRGETEYGVKAIWAGAYVKITGMSNLEEVDPADEHRTYRVKSYPRKVLVASAGSITHFVGAFVLLVAFFGFSGVPDQTQWTIQEVSAGGPAADAGIQPGERVTAVDGETAETFNDLVALVGPQAGETVELTVLGTGGTTRQVDLTIGTAVLDDGSTTGRIGIRRSPDVPDTTSGLIGGIGDAATELPRLGQLTFEGIGQFATNFGDFIGRVFTAPGADDATANPESRPVSVIGIVQVGADSAGDGFSNVLYLLALFNVFVGIFNLLPLLPLDGGHIAVATYERLRSRNGQPYVADMTKLLPVTYAVFLFLVFLGLGAVYLDIANPIV